MFTYDQNTDISTYRERIASIHYIKQAVQNERMKIKNQAENEKENVINSEFYKTILLNFSIYCYKCFRI